MAIFEGTGQGNILVGADTDDILIGRAGNDRLIGGLGADSLLGGTGRDFAKYLGINAQTMIIADLLAGIGTGEDAEGDTYDSIEGLIGSIFGDRLIGDNLDNRLLGREGDDEIFGNDGDDQISGGRGADTLSGGDGDDWLLYRQSDSGVTVDLGAGLAANGHAQGDIISGFENLFGSDHADVLTGTSQDNILRGGRGDDTLQGGDGDDRLIGGPGGDIMDGGAGFDTVSYAGETDNVSVNTRNGQMLSAARGDTLISIEGLVGTDLGDSLILGDGPSRIVGRGGNDFLDGGNGNDKLIGGAGRDFIHGGPGIDTAIYRSSPAAVQISLENMTYRGGDAEGDTLSWIHNIDGSQFDDVIEGNLLSNRLRGLDGDDLLMGRAGSDKLVGGAGADTLSGGEGDDTFSFVKLEDHVGQTQDAADPLVAYSGSDADTITDFVSGTDVLQFKVAAFSGSVVNTDDIADLGLNTANASGFAYTGSELFYVHYASVEDFDAGTATVHHMTSLDNIADLAITDFEFV
ncbi:MAG: calcium-binding protein [Sedimentitalea sp.]|uniref:calcium-binding protein n=1 Tax=Sedimentitalea sp. TaxID=2048915 RepID=UPI003265D137